MTSPSTRTAPGQTRGVQSALRRSASGMRSSRSAPWRRKYASPLGRSRAEAAASGAAQERRLVAREDPRIADRGSHGCQRSGESIERLDASPLRDPRPLSERRRRRRAEDMQVPPRELEAGVTRIDPRCRHGPDRRQSRAVPPHHDRSGGCRVPEPVGVLAEGAAGLAVGHLRPVEEALQPSSQVLSQAPSAGLVGQPPEREDREVAGGHDVRVVPRSPELDERWVLPRRGFGRLDARMDREERRLGACCPAGPPTLPAATSVARVGAARRARPRADGTRGSAAS